MLILDIREGNNRSAYSGLCSCLTVLSFMLKNKYRLRFCCINHGKVSRYSSSADPFSSLNNTLEHGFFSGDNSRACNLCFRACIA